MASLKDPLLQLNARIHQSVSKKFNMAVAAKGLTKQEALEEAIMSWVHKGEKELPPVDLDFPTIPARGKKKINPTKEQLDEAMFG